MQTKNVTFPKLPKVFKRKWVAALRSGKFKQGKGGLYSHRNAKDTYCCLGVACVVAGEIPSSYDGFITPIKRYKKVPDILKGSGNLPETLSGMNDGGFVKPGLSFRRIATWIEKNL